MIRSDFPNLDKLPEWEVEHVSEPVTGNGVTYRFIEFINTEKLIETKSPGAIGPGTCLLLPIIASCSPALWVIRASPKGRAFVYPFLCCSQNHRFSAKRAGRCSFFCCVALCAQIFPGDPPQDISIRPEQIFMLDYTDPASRFIPTIPNRDRSSVDQMNGFEILYDLSVYI